MSVVAMAWLGKDQATDYAELETAWRLLCEAGEDVEGSCPCCGEQWQYMGSVKRSVSRSVELWSHQFRHRHHPRTLQREVHEVPASQGFQPTVERGVYA